MCLITSQVVLEQSFSKSFSFLLVVRKSSSFPQPCQKLKSSDPRFIVKETSISEEKDRNTQYCHPFCDLTCKFITTASPKGISMWLQGEMRNTESNPTCMTQPSLSVSHMRQWPFTEQSSMSHPDPAPRGSCVALTMHRSPIPEKSKFLSTTPCQKYKKATLHGYMNMHACVKTTEIRHTSVEKMAWYS